MATFIINADVDKTGDAYSCNLAVDRQSCTLSGISEVNPATSYPHDVFLGSYSGRGSCPAGANGTLANKDGNRWLLLKCNSDEGEFAFLLSGIVNTPSQAGYVHSASNIELINCGNGESITLEEQQALDEQAANEEIAEVPTAKCCNSNAQDISDLRRELNQLKRQLNTKANLSSLNTVESSIKGRTNPLAEKLDNGLDFLGQQIKDLIIKDKQDLERQFRRDSAYANEV